MTIADTSCETIGGLFFRQMRDLTVSTVREKRKYNHELDGILSIYAPEASRMFRQRLAVYR